MCLFIHERPWLHESIWAGLAGSVDISSDGPIPAASVISNDIPISRKRKNKGYETLTTALSAIVDPFYKQQRLEMMASSREMLVKKKLKHTVMYSE